MAQFENNFVQDLQQDIKIRQCGTIVFNADNLSNVVSVELYNGEEAYSGGGTVVGAVVCPDGATVALDGTLSGNKASITLTGDCFALPGQIGVSIQIVSGDVRTTVLKAIYNVDVSSTDTIVDPGSRITLSLAEIEAKLDEIPTILANAQTAIDGIEAQKDNMIASIASVAGQGTDTTLTQSGVAADAKATGDQVRDLKSALDVNKNDTISMFQQALDGGNVAPKDYPIFINGKRATTGSLVDTAYHETITTPQKIKVEQGDYLVFDSTVYKVDLLGYTNASDDASSVDTGFVTVSPLNILGTLNKTYMNINVRHIDGSDIYVDEMSTAFYIAHAPIENNLVTKEFLEQENFVQKTVGKNKFNKDSPDIVSGKYRDIGDTEKTNNAYSYLRYIPCDPSEDYYVNKGYCYVLFYDADKIYISGLTNSSAFTFTTPATAKFMCLSYPTAGQGTLQLEIGTSGTSYESYIFGLNGEEIQDNSIGLEKLSFDTDLIERITITVDANGNGDYTSLRSAIESITDSSQRKQYRVEIFPGTYDLRQDYNSTEISASGFVGLKIPDHVSLVGVGGKEITEITWDGSEDVPASEISTLNLQNVCSLFGLTVSANNIRYAVHDDYATTGARNVRVVENCDFVGTNLEHLQVYGAGQKGNADWRFYNCRFLTNDNAGTGFAIHNNVNQTKESYLEFDNCKFTGQDYANIYLASMNNGTVAFNHAVFKGCSIVSGSHIRLNEIDASLYGAGVKWKVSGYGNTFDNADFTFGNTDGQDYTSYVDLI